MNDIDSFNQALIECVKAAGGSKVVASLLWPEKPLQDAQRLLLACLNDDRPEKLSPDQSVFIMRKAKDANCHLGIHYLCNLLGYTIPTPIEPADEKVILMRQFIDAQNSLTELIQRMERLGK